jgi:prepilin-type N-terminal cleavage/methylation domain-containing protein
MKKGFTLVEVIVSMVIIAIVIYAGIAIFITSGAKGANVEIFTVAQCLAEGKLEEAMAKDFADVASVAETSFSGDLGSYSWEILSSYVSGEALDTAVAGATDYKKIQVMIRHPKLGNPIQLESIRANY